MTNAFELLSHACKLVCYDCGANHPLSKKHPGNPENPLPWWHTRYDGEYAACKADRIRSVLMKQENENDITYESVMAWAVAQRPILHVKHFNKRVYIKHSDGSTFDYKHAFAVKVNDFVVVFSEHTDYHVFFHPDLETASYSPASIRIFPEADTTKPVTAFLD